MAYETKNVLSLDSKDAMDFFLKSEQSMALSSRSILYLTNYFKM